MSRGMPGPQKAQKHQGLPGPQKAQKRLGVPGPQKAQKRLGVPQKAQITIGWCLLLVLFSVACRQATPLAVARSTEQRAAGRAYDGAPPVIPHAIVGECTTCHDHDGSEIAGVGVAPASPHGAVAATGAMRRCRQCHVPSTTPEVMVASVFNGLPQGPWQGDRATPGAPPTIPHTLQLRENCLACHAGPASRAEIRTSHPERPRCRQCHAGQ